jgi:hypothetical protein
MGNGANISGLETQASNIVEAFSSLPPRSLNESMFKVADRVQIEAPPVLKKS